MAQAQNNMNFLSTITSESGPAFTGQGPMRADPNRRSGLLDMLGIGGGAPRTTPQNKSNKTRKTRKTTKSNEPPSDKINDALGIGPSLAPTEDDGSIEQMLLTLKATKDASIEDRELNIRNLMEQQRMILKNTKAELDLTPMAALVDNLTGSNFAQTYKSPTATKNNLRQLASLRNQVHQEKLSMHADANQATKLQISTKLARDKTAANKELRMAAMALSANKDLRKAQMEKAPAAFVKNVNRYKATIYSAKQLLSKIMANPSALGWGKNATQIKALQYLGGKFGSYVKNRENLRGEMLKMATQYGKTFENRLTDKDQERYEKIIGMLDESPEKVAADLQRIITETQQLWRDEYDSWGRGRYNVVGNEPPGRAPTPATPQQPETGGGTPKPVAGPTPELSIEDEYMSL